MDQGNPVAMTIDHRSWCQEQTELRKAYQPTLVSKALPIIGIQIKNLANKMSFLFGSRYAEYAAGAIVYSPQA